MALTRWTALVSVALCCLSLGACGGGSGSSSSLPDGSNGGNSGQDNSPMISPESPASVVGSSATSNVPGLLNIQASGAAAQVEAVLERHGCSLVAQQGSWWTIQLPAGANLDSAKAELEKEYCVITAEKVSQIQCPRALYASQVMKSSSYYPLDPMYADTFISLGNNTVWVLQQFAGPAHVMDTMGFPGAWGISDPANIRGDVANEPVRVAIIDAGWFDYSTLDRSGFDETLIDAANSGFVDGTGAFTAGLAAATWDLVDDGDPLIADYPYRDTGEVILGILGATHNDYQPRALDFDDINDGLPDGIQSDEIWNDGIAGINPNATFILLKTGHESGGAWTFNDNELAAAINRAWNQANADIIVLGMWGLGSVAVIIDQAIQNARDNGALTIAAAGDVVASAQFDGGGVFIGWGDPPVDITSTPVTPASDPTCLSVCCTGFNRAGALPDVDVGGDMIDNNGMGWNPRFNYPFDDTFSTVAQYSNTGADIAASAYGVGFSFHPYIVQGGDPNYILPGENYVPKTTSFSSAHAAAYVAGAASMAFQALYYTDGTPPDPDTVENILLSTVEYSPMAGTANGGLLSADKALFQAMSTGGLPLFEPGIEFDSVVLSQPVSAITRGTSFSLTPTVQHGNAPLELTIDWGDGAGEQVVSPWVNGDPVTYTGGYETLGVKPVNLTVTDDNSALATISFAGNVINPLGANITIEDVSGAVVAPNNLQAGVTYRFNANPINVYTGDIGGTPNDTVFEWDFNGDDIVDFTGESPVHSFASAGDFGLVLTVTETVRPDTVFAVDITVN